MPNFNEVTRDFIEYPIYYYDVTYSMSLPVRGIGGAAGVIVNGWDPINLVPSLVHVSAAGALSVEGSISATTSATATAAAPVYVEGSTDALSMDLGGALRVTGTISASSTVKSTAAAPTYVEGSSNPFSSDLAGGLRVTGAFFQATQPVSLASSPNPSNLDVALSTRTKPSDQQHVIVDSSAAVAVTGPLTDTQLRATPVPVSGTVTATTGGLTDTQLRATAVPISLATNTPSIKDTNGNTINSSGPGFLRTSDEPHQLFYDPFDGSVVDTTNRWLATFGLGAAVAPSQVGGQMTVDAGATSGGWASLTSQNALVPTIPAWLGISFALSLTDGAALVSSGYRFWGVGTVPGVPTVATPLTDAVGFEVTGGKMYAVVYAAGVRTAVQDMSAATGNSTAPTDALNHRYIVYVRTDKIYWYIDSLTTPAATSSFQSPSVQTLPIRYLAVSGGAATQILSPGVASWDTGKNNTQISDGTYAWRKATVSAAGAIKVDNSAVTQPVSVASMITVNTVDGQLANMIAYQNLLVQRAGPSGFVPLAEIPAFLAG